MNCQDNNAHNTDGFVSSHESLPNIMCIVTRNHHAGSWMVCCLFLLDCFPFFFQDIHLYLSLNLVSPFRLCYFRCNFLACFSHFACPFCYVLLSYASPSRHRFPPYVISIAHIFPAMYLFSPSSYYNTVAK
ncbi:hypothetical protein C8Q75DRAFT_110311 [Abortiporus biennis]|nr:hypothetical protein C8Q75DRAFT_110311 [Abortiporus biennis]